ncbi:MAG: alpha/beta fold hydrolase [Proteobacteria bacterium]|nr:MAG: alpha/beta fold hydrolase [Pseudomonadota bacterium]QKK11558.1 MAG: alpha/beta fold hydrolase [Pseudomonadota bacterium]
MHILELSDGNGLFYIYTPPRDEHGKTYVFFNALTGDTGMWEGVIGETLRAAGHGTLSFNFRGQKDSPFSRELDLDESLIVEDARRLLQHLQPSNVILVGLSIGGLFAAKTWLGGIKGVAVCGLVLINTLRCDGPRLQWINDALVRCARVGGLGLFRDLFAPLLFNEAWLAENRRNFLQDTPYAPLPSDSGHANLLRNAGAVNWNVPYEELVLPVLVVTGLQDRVFLDLDDVVSLYARLPNARRIDMPDAAHLLPAEQPAALATVLVDFGKAL